MARPRLPMRGALLPAAVLLVTSSTIARAQDFEGIVTARVKGMPGGGDMKTYLKGGKYRVEISMPGQGAVAIIADPVAGETYMLMPAQSMYMVMKLADAERMADSLIRRKVGEESSLVATGKTEEIAGHRCEYYRFRDGKSVTDVCLTTGLGMFRGGASMFGGGMPGRSAPPWVRELLQKGAFPLKVTDSVGVAIWEVTTVEKKRLDAALFTLPANYQRMQMPGRPPQ